jgi:hypothetical protein
LDTSDREFHHFASRHHAWNSLRWAVGRPILYDLYVPIDLMLLTDYITVANNFWGPADAGVNPLLQRMQNAKQTCDELKVFYTGMSQRKHDDAGLIRTSTRHN